MTDEKKTTTEEFTVSADKVISKVKEIVDEGLARKIIFKDENGKELASFPLVAGIAGVFLAPILAFAGTLVALATSCTIVVVRESNGDESLTES